ncbi:2,3-bisphosphoglycerate-dependent phosphoglycerate mutase [Enterococcus alishanensis]|uniref:2,3-bisphosphoglycerate-dependent phosphoglycerate mutase n=1 Tax=Enterococcus alishanensis TaxID=1303817 RepID=A0ABS6TBV2_9ENTE|nr:2,3-diphosphoglycerate-dependent phosphoglycerate mutase [Enterococcus alishanensis]MBV7390339.1 2,3-diphosphoglycerate-dependent phosphoglycerate mutase [Enterococcus alishanensis]
MPLILIRHGESEANFANYWTGWLDVNLTEKGREQAMLAGKKISEAGYQIDLAFESVLKRSILTAELILEQNNASAVPEFKTWRLNERHYGDLVGKNKAKMTAEYGAEQVEKWRRGYDEVPPQVKINHFDRRYNNLDPRLIPKGESLHQTEQRVIPLWQDEIVPELKAGKTVLVVGHGNSLRSLIRYIEEVPPLEVNQIDIPNATAMIYDFDQQMKITHKKIM